MSKIVRTTTRAEGGITPAEKKKLDAHAQLWIDRIMRTAPIEKDKIIPAIEGLYEVAGLKKPRVVIAPSPLVASISAGLAAGVWYLRKNDAATYAATRAATYDATRDATDAATRDATRDATDAATDAATDDATRDATYAATDAATYAATDAATYAATDDATRDATRDATYAATDAATDAATYAATDDATRDATDAATRDATRDATDAATDDAQPHWLKKLAQTLTPNAVEFSLGCVRLSYRLRNGGNMWGQYDSYLTAFRDVLGLTGLDVWDKYKYYEQTAIHGGYRYMHEEFCIVSDFPTRLEKDENNQPHSDTGPSHEWRDGFKLFYLHGVKFEQDLWEKIVSHKLTAKEFSEIRDVDQRRQALRYMSGEHFIKSSGAKLVNTGEHERFAEMGKETLAYHYKLYKVKAGTIFTKDKYFLFYPHTGTGEELISWVTPYVEELGEDADAIIAAKHNTTKQEYFAGWTA